MTQPPNWNIPPQPSDGYPPTPGASYTPPPTPSPAPQQPYGYPAPGQPAPGYYQQPPQPQQPYFGYGPQNPYGGYGQQQPVSWGRKVLSNKLFITMLALVIIFLVIAVSLAGVSGNSSPSGSNTYFPTAASRITDGALGSSNGGTGNGGGASTPQPTQGESLPQQSQNTSGDDTENSPSDSAGCGIHATADSTTLPASLQTATTYTFPLGTPDFIGSTTTDGTVVKMACWYAASEDQVISLADAMDTLYGSDGDNNDNDQITWNNTAITPEVANISVSGTLTTGKNNGTGAGMIVLVWSTS